MLLHCYQANVNRKQIQHWETKQNSSKQNALKGNKKELHHMCKKVFN